MAQIHQISKRGFEKIAKFIIKIFRNYMKTVEVSKIDYILRHWPKNCTQLTK